MIINKKYIGVESHTKGIIIPSFEIASRSGNNLSFDKLKINNDGTFTISVSSSSDFGIYKLAEENKINIDRFTDFDVIYNVTLSLEEIELILLSIIKDKKIKNKKGKK